MYSRRRIFIDILFSIDWMITHPPTPLSCSLMVVQYSVPVPHPIGPGKTKYTTTQTVCQPPKIVLFDAQNWGLTKPVGYAIIEPMGTPPPDQPLLTYNQFQAMLNPPPNEAEVWKAKYEALALNVTDIQAVRNAESIVVAAIDLSRTTGAPFRQVFTSMLEVLYKNRGASAAKRNKRKSKGK